MGTPVPDPPIDYGNDCLGCTIPPGTLWEPGETPLNIWVYFAGIKKCFWFTDDPPNGSTFKLTQMDIEHCLWTHSGSVWTVQLNMCFDFPAKSSLMLLDSGMQIQFNSRGVPCPEECTIFNNGPEFFPPPPDFPEGVAVIHWMGIVLTLVVSMSLPSASKLMHELFVTDDDKIVHKFCMPKYSMNVKMLTE